MKKKLFKTATTILASIILVPIFVLGAIQLMDLFPKRAEAVNEEVRIYQTLPLNEEFSFERGDFDEFTDEDSFFVDGEKHESIEYYKRDNLYGSTVSIENINYITDGHRYFLDVLRAVGDDPIVNIVPREFFNSVGEYTVVGKEYGIALRFRPGAKTLALISVGLY